MSEPSDLRRVTCHISCGGPVDEGADLCGGQEPTRSLSRSPAWPWLMSATGSPSLTPCSWAAAWRWWSPGRGVRSAGIVFAMRNELDYSAVWLGQLLVFGVAWSAIVRRVCGYSDATKSSPCILITTQFNTKLTGHLWACTHMQTNAPIRTIFLLHSLLHPFQLR